MPEEVKLDMHYACMYHICMSTVQIRNVPTKTHRTLKMRAAKMGVSLSDFLLKELERLAARPTLVELTERILAQEPVGKPLDSVAAVRAEREKR